MRTRYWLIVITTIVIISGLRECQNRRDIDKAVISISEYSDTVKAFKIKDGAQVYENNSLKLSSQKQIAELSSKINDTVRQITKKFKSLNNVTFAKGDIVITKDTIKLHDTIPCSFKPFKVTKDNVSYKFTGTIAPNYFSVDSIYIPNNITFVSGRKRVGFMKYDYVVDINNSNALVNTTNIKSYQYVPVKKWYEKTWVHVVAGAALMQGAITGFNLLIKK